MLDSPKDWSLPAAVKSSEDSSLPLQFYILCRIVDSENGVSQTIWLEANRVSKKTVKGLYKTKAGHTLEGAQDILTMLSHREVKEYIKEVAQGACVRSEALAGREIKEKDWYVSEQELERYPESWATVIREFQQYVCKCVEDKRRG